MEPSRPPRPPRSETPEVVALKALREDHPDLTEAVNMHLELLEMQRRVQGRVPLPSLDITAAVVTARQQNARPLLRFEDIPLDITDLRLMVRQTLEVLHRFGALDDADRRIVEAAGRDAGLTDVVAAWYRRAAGHHAVAGLGVAAAAPADVHPGLEQVLGQAMRPFLARCAEVLQPREELAIWTHPHCPLCGGEPDLSVITPAAERHLLCGRCGLRWKFEPLTCPYCRNSDRTRITSFATPDGQYRVYACDVCLRYLKAYDGRRAPRPVMPVVDGVATLPLDAAAIQRGYS